jgi:hypothetical protein
MPSLWVFDLPRVSYALASIWPLSRSAVWWRAPIMKYLIMNFSPVACCTCSYCYDSRSFCWALAAFSVSWSCTQSVGPLGRGISRSQGLYLHTGQHKHRISAYNTDIHALSEIRTHDPSVRASKDSSCLRPRGHCDRPVYPCTPGIFWICVPEELVAIYLKYLICHSN